MSELIEVTIKNYLDGVLDVPVSLEIPKETSSAFVVFQITDRDKVDLINKVTVRLYSYGQSNYQAALLDEKVREAMENITDLNEVFSSKIGGGGANIDNTLKKYRYTCYYNLTY